MDKTNNQSDAGVTQADRDAAAEVLGGVAPDGLLEGKQDSLSLVQAFARHRQQAIAQHEGGRGEPSAEEECHRTARELRENANGDCSAAYQAILWDEKAAALEATRPAALAEDEVEALAERLREGVHSVGLDRDNNTELFDIEDADEAMCEAATCITQQAEEVARLREALRQAADNLETGNRLYSCPGLNAAAQLARAALNEQPGREEG